MIHETFLESTAIKNGTVLGICRNQKLLHLCFGTVAFGAPDKSYPLWLVSKQGFDGILLGKMTNICCLVVERHE